MKKILALGAAVMLLISCSSSAPVSRSTQSDLKGNWTISDVTYPGSNVIKINSFDIADSKCFKGSAWKFISNNNKGNLELTQSGCSTFTSPIVWSITKENDFTLKIVDPSIKAKNVTQGYVLKYQPQSETSFQLIDKVNVGGKLTNVVYQFQKVNE